MIRLRASLVHAACLCAFCASISLLCIAPDAFAIFAIISAAAWLGAGWIDHLENYHYRALMRGPEARALVWERRGAHLCDCGCFSCSTRQAHCMAGECMRIGG